MELEKIKKVNFTKLEQEAMKLIRKHCNDNEELEKDLFTFIEMIQEERRRNDDIKELVIALASKI